MAAAAAAAALDHACRKHRINQLFARPEAERINQAIRHAVHPIMSEATLLVKDRLLKETYALGKGGRNMAPMVIDEDEVEKAVSAIVDKVQVRKTRGLLEEDDDNGIEKRGQQAQEWVNAYTNMRRGIDGESNPLASRMEGLSVRKILSLAIRAYVSVLLTNIRYHFANYVKRVLGVLLKKRAAEIENVADFDSLTRSAKNRWGRLFRVAYDDILDIRLGNRMQSDDRIHDVVENARPFVVPTNMKPTVITVDDDLCNTDRCFVYLGYMIRITRFLSVMGQTSLPSPLPLKTSFIPAHYNIDTASISQLLFSQTGRKTIKGFSNYFEHSIKGGFPLPGLKTKAQLCKGLQSLCPTGRIVTTEDNENYMDAIWTYLGRFNSRKKAMRYVPLFAVTKKKRFLSNKPLMLFDHSISSDGYSVSLVMSNAVVRGRHGYTNVKRTMGPKKKKTGVIPISNSNSTPIDASTGLPVLTPETALYWADQFLTNPSLAKSRKTGGDPGKGVILQIVDAEDAKLRYTSAQRTFETGGGCEGRTRIHKAKIAKARSKMPTYRGQPIRPTIHSIERFLLHTSPRSATLGAFREYIKRRESVRTCLEEMYSKTVFRWNRFLAWSRRDISVKKFVKKILEKFGSGGTQQVVIFYGDWGRSPNLKNQAPTPGIGFRRLLHATQGILTITVREHFTSSFCPCCDREVEQARNVHGVLKCTGNGQGCGQARSASQRSALDHFWSRDVLGAKNILRKAEYMIAHPGMAHPLFG